MGLAYHLNKTILTILTAIRKFHVVLMGDRAQSHQVTSQVPAVPCDRVTHTLECPSVTLAAVEVTVGHNWYPVTKAVLKLRLGIMGPL